jgi:hypothetical protein
VNIVAVIKHIKIRNSNYDAATDYLCFKHDEFTNKPILNEDGQMIPRDEYLLDGINCDPFNFGRECESTNAYFKKNNTRSEVKAHHYIISFDPRDKDENGLTPDRAQELGKEFATKNFPGHQTIICTHPDGHNSAGNIHVHIVINSVRKFDAPQQSFMERPGDAKAGNKHRSTNKLLEHLKQETMHLCQREQFYQVDLLSPAKIRITDREYWAQRKGQKKLDQENKEKIESGITPDKTEFETENGFLRRVITATLDDSNSMEEFQKKLFENYGIAVHESRGRISYKLPNKERPIRGRQLGTNFEKEYLQDFLLKKNIPTIDIAATSKQKNLATKHTPPSKSIRLIVDIEANIKAQQNRFYAQKVKVGNLQQMSKTLAFLQENDIGTLEELEHLLTSTQSDFDEKRISLKATEDRLKTVNLLIKNSGQYLAHKQIYGEYLKAKNKKKFREEHESEIILYESARKELKQLTNGEKIPSLKQLRAEKEKLTHRKNQEYEDYSFSRAKLRELQTIHSNVNTILGKEQVQEKDSLEH